MVNKSFFRASAGHAIVSGILSVFILLIFISCQSSGGREENVRWFTDYNNGLHVKTTFSDLIFDLQYLPHDFVQTQRDNGDGVINGSDDMQYYRLKISAQGGSDLIGYTGSDTRDIQSMDYYFSYRFQNDLALEEDGKILPCVLYHFEKRRNADGGRTFVIGFENVNNNSREAKFVISSDVFSTLGIKIKINKANTPTYRL